MAWVRFRRKDMPGGLWTKCPTCGEMVFTKELVENFKICKKCGFHMTPTVEERVQFTLDPGSFEELYVDLRPVDRLEFTDKTTYAEKLAETKKKAGRDDAMVIGVGRIQGREVAFGAMDFKFLGGSMGVVVGEKVTLAIEIAQERGIPLVLVSASGGARMHEGALSLMQMAKTCAALARFADRGGLYVSILTNPTTGGVTASFATMADVIVAEPGALIGFAGPRVIQNTIKQDLPEGFQRSEFLLKRGQIDLICPRNELPQTLFRIMEHLKPSEPGSLVLPTLPRFASPPENGKHGHDGDKKRGDDETAKRDAKVKKKKKE